MDAKVAAEKCKPFIEKCDKLPDVHEQWGKDHLLYMIEQIGQMKTFDRNQRDEFFTSRMKEIIDQDDREKRAQMMISFHVEIQEIFKSNEKAMRWIGWLQACIAMGGGATLEDMKRINVES